MKKQKGAALIIALIMLVILTILGVAVMESTVIEERMAGNNIVKNRVFQAAESALREAEEQISDWIGAPIVGQGVVNLLGAPDPAVYSWWTTQTDAWWRGADTQQATLQDATLTTNPRYYIEEYSTVCDTLVDPKESECTFVFRITAIAWGGRNTTALLQSLYSRKF